MELFLCLLLYTSYDIIKEVNPCSWTAEHYSALCDAFKEHGESVI